MKLSDECYTPADWLRVARDVLGGIDLDPASNVTAQALVRADRFFTVDDDGLAQRWAGRVWMNPPYSKPGPWVEKLLEAYDSGEVTAAIALLNARTGAGWYQGFAARAWRCEKRKRIKFYGPGAPGGTGRMDSCFFYLGAEPARFVSAFSRFGHVVPPSVTRSVTGALCSVCSRSLSGMRADAEVCSSRCRQKLYRRRSIGGVERGDARRSGGGQVGQR